MGCSAKRAALKGEEVRLIDIACHFSEPEILADWLKVLLKASGIVGDVCLVQALVKAGEDIGGSLNATISARHEGVANSLLGNGAAPASTNNAEHSDQGQSINSCILFFCL